MVLVQIDTCTTDEYCADMATYACEEVKTFLYMCEDCPTTFAHPNRTLCCYVFLL